MPDPPPTSRGSSRPGRSTSTRRATRPDGAAQEPTAEISATGTGFLVDSPLLGDDMWMAPALAPGWALRAIWKGKWLILAAIVVASAGTYAAVSHLSPQYSASTVVNFNQPQVTATGQEGLAATQKLLDLMPTYAAVATSDQVLSAASTDLSLNQSPSSLRNRVAAGQEGQELAISISVTGSSAPAANSLDQAVETEFARAIDQEQIANGIPSSLKLVLTRLTNPAATEETRHIWQTTLLAGVTMLVLASAIAALAQYIRSQT